MSEFRKRIIDPMVPPVVAIVFIGVLVFSMSRILLAVPEVGSTTLALLISAEILGVAAVLAATSRLKASQRLTMLFIGVGLIGGGAAAASIGVRPIEAHGETINIAAKGLAFLEKELHFPVDTEVHLLFNNLDAGVPHNVAISKGNEALFTGEVIPGVRKILYTIPPLAEGKYPFICSVHPQMKGDVIVSQEGETGAHHGSDPAGEPEVSATPSPTAPAPTQSEAPGGPTSAEIVATDDVFNVKELELAAGAQISIEFVNQGSNPHNWALYEEQGGPAIFNGEIATGGQTKTYTFTAPRAGTYHFQCDVHPKDMVGTAKFS